MHRRSSDVPHACRGNAVDILDTSLGNTGESFFLPRLLHFKLSKFFRNPGGLGVGCSLSWNATRRCGRHASMRALTGVRWGFMCRCSGPVAVVKRRLAQLPAASATVVRAGGMGCTCAPSSERTAPSIAGSCSGVKVPASASYSDPARGAATSRREREAAAKDRDLD